MSGGFPPIGINPPPAPAPGIPQQPAPMFSNPLFNSQSGGFNNPMYGQPQNYGAPQGGNLGGQPQQEEIGIGDFMRRQMDPAQGGPYMGNQQQAYDNLMQNRGDMQMPGGYSFGNLMGGAIQKGLGMMQQGGNPVSADMRYRGGPEMSPQQRQQREQFMQQQATQASMGNRNMSGLDPRAVAANPAGFAQWQQGAQAQEQAMPGSTMMAPAVMRPGQGGQTQYGRMGGQQGAK